LFAIFINTIIYGIITLWWKISIHCAGIAGYLSATTLIFGPRHVILWLIIPLLCWSRIRVKAHTPLQTLVGAVLGGVLTWLEIWLADYWFDIL
jgi:membrane-associated phospholipid phosphatase